MNDETEWSEPDETNKDATEVTNEVSETVAYISTEGVVLEDSEETISETVAMTTEPTEPVYLEVIQDSANAVIHADLFGAFLICGTLIGLFLLRGRYGT